MQPLDPTPNLALSPTSHSLPSLRRKVADAVRQGNYTTALALINQILRQQPSSALDYNNRGFIQFHLGNYTAALQDLNTALRLDRSLDSAYNNRGNCYAQQYRFTHALWNYHQALAYNPHNHRARLNLGITLRDMGLARLALENFEYLIVQGQISLHAQAERGRTHHVMGHWNWAMADYHQVWNQLLEQSDLSFHPLRHSLERWMDELVAVVI
ncbi:MAG: tetratricopeptide repeat protein [Prochlorothrix sp.]